MKSTYTLFSKTAVDLFAGAGGFSTGARMAGVHVAWAANHWPDAVDCHTRNHADTRHACQDLQQADWTKVPRHDLLLASPCCQGHSRARGTDKPHHDAARSTAWAVVSCAEMHRPRHVLVENVPEYRSWALFPAWRLAMQALGYHLDEQIVNAADHGVPQARVRLFIRCQLDAKPAPYINPRLPHVPAESIIRWDAGRWAPINKPGRSPATLARIAGGRAIYGDRFMVGYYGNERGGRDPKKPMGTVTTRDRFAVIQGDRMRMLMPEENRDAMGIPSDYWLPEDKSLATHLLGNAVCPPVARDLIRGLVA